MRIAKERKVFLYRKKRRSFDFYYSFRQNKLCLLFSQLDMMTEATAVKQQTGPNTQTMVTSAERQALFQKLYEKLFEF